MSDLLAERTAKLVSAARAWVADCEWMEDPDDLETYSDAEIVDGINRHYEGGWRQFVIDAGAPRETDRVYLGE